MENLNKSVKVSLTLNLLALKERMRSIFEKHHYILPSLKASLWFSVLIPLLLTTGFIMPYIWVLVMGVTTLFIKYYGNEILKQKVLETNEYLLSFVQPEFREEYNEDTTKWTERIYDYDRTPLRKVFLILFVILSVRSGISWITNGDLFFETHALLNVPQNGHLLYFFCALFLNGAFLAIAQSGIELGILFYGTADILHHFTFWEMQDYYPKEDKTLSHSRNPLAELIILNCLFLVVIVVSFGYLYLIGIALGIAIFIFSPIKPTENFNFNLNRKYKRLLRGIPAVVLLGLFLNLTFGIMTNGSAYWLVIQTILLLIFLKNWFGFFYGRKKASFATSAKTYFEELADKLHIRYEVLIVALSIIPLIFTSLAQVDFYFREGYILFEHIRVFFSAFLLSMSCIAVYFMLKIVRIRTGELTDIFLEKTYEHKKEETVFHYWECFSGPQAFMFTATIGFIIFYLFINPDNAFYKRLFMNLTPALKFPFAFTLLFLGIGVGMMIWLGIYAPHLLWHMIALIDLDHQEKHAFLGSVNFTPEKRWYAIMVGVGMFYFLLFLFLFFNYPSSALIRVVLVSFFLGIAGRWIFQAAIKNGHDSHGDSLNQ